jgi:DNA repair protein RecN (Recombination protein N)
MLTELRIENFAIIQSLELEFAPGLTTFTGETGAGKSIILDAIVALLGGRIDATYIRAGAERAAVEGIFSIPAASRAAVAAILEREDLDDEGEYLTLARELRQNGRSVARVNGRSVAVTLLREFGEFLVDIHGQSEHLSLLNVRQHLHLLDDFAAVRPALAAYRESYRSLRQVQKELNALRQSEQDAARKVDMLEYQVQEIESAALKADEEDELRQERARLANAESLASLAQQALMFIDEGSPETPAASDLLGQAASALDSLARIDAGQQALSEQMQALNDTLAEVSRDVRAYLENIEFNPRRLEQVEERLDLLQRLKRKYGGSLAAVLAFAEQARAELENITHASERIEALEQQENNLLSQAGSQAARLSALRAQAAGQLARGVEAELNDLSMAGARFSVQIERSADPAGLRLPAGERVSFDENGIDRVEFLIAPNPGEGLKPLVKIASGGETSRLMLALKKVLTQADAIPTLIFDEIDQGIGGRVGTVVGEKLWQLGRQHQVLCITHLPQLAAYGDQHFSVRKLVEDGRTSTRVEALYDQKRLMELAQMLGAVTQANLDAAEAALAAARYRTRELESKPLR